MPAQPATSAVTTTSAAPTDSAPSTSDASTGTSGDTPDRDDEITQATADLALQCALTVAEFVHFDPAWISATVPPDTAAIDPELLERSQERCAAARDAVGADTAPGVEKGWALELAGQLDVILGVLNAPTVDMAANSGMPMAMLNVNSMLDGSFFGNRPGLVITP